MAYLTGRATCAHNRPRGRHGGATGKDPMGYNAVDDAMRDAERDAMRDAEPDFPDYSDEFYEMTKARRLAQPGDWDYVEDDGEF